jgi:hypothetical protein
MDALAGISPQHPRGDRMRSLARLGDEHLQGLGTDWQQLDAQLHGTHDADRRAALARQRAVVRNLHIVLTAGVDLLRDFEPGQVAGEAPALREPVAALLRHESREATGAAGPSGGALAYAALVPPPLRRVLLGAPLHDAGARGRLHALCARNDHRFMHEAALLMVRHYAHPDHGTFNVMRAAHELDRSCPELAVGAQFADLARQFAEGIGGIYRLAPMRAGAPLFKGAVPEAFWQLRAGLDFRLERPLSTSREREQCFLGRQPPGRPAYDHLFTYLDGARSHQRLDAVDITLFHPAQTLHQREALLLPGQDFVVTGQSSGDAPGQHGPQPAQFIEVHKLGRSPGWERFAAYYGQDPPA